MATSRDGKMTDTEIQLVINALAAKSKTKKSTNPDDWKSLVSKLKNHPFTEQGVCYAIQDAYMDLDKNFGFQSYDEARDALGLQVFRHPKIENFKDFLQKLAPIAPTTEQDIVAINRSKDRDVLNSLYKVIGNNKNEENRLITELYKESKLVVAERKGAISSADYSHVKTVLKKSIHNLDLKAAQIAVGKITDDNKLIAINKAKNLEDFKKAMGPIYHSDGIEWSESDIEPIKRMAAQRQIEILPKLLTSEVVLGEAKLDIEKHKDIGELKKLKTNSKNK